MKWQPSPIIKLYEALGSIADGRVHVSENSAKVYSSSGNKYYDVLYDPKLNAITANDNGSYWVGYLGYPSIAFLLVKGIVRYDEELAGYLKGFAWKDINTRFKNDFTKTRHYIDDIVARQHGFAIEDFHRKLEVLLKEINDLKLEKLPTTTKPPGAY